MLVEDGTGVVAVGEVEVGVFALLRTLLVELLDGVLLVEDDVAVGLLVDLLLLKILWLLGFVFEFIFACGVVFVVVVTWLEEVLVVKLVGGVVVVEEEGGDEEVAPVVVIVGNALAFDIFVFEFELLIIAMPLLAFEIEDVDVVFE